jgi:beta-lactamase superfamily II metal-dependent hydrolase
MAKTTKSAKARASKAKASKAKKSKTAKKAKAKTAAKKSSTKLPTSNPAGDGPLKPPPGGAVVRMYRVGHGDCFLIAFAGESPDKPAYVLIDCGYKPGSPGKLSQPTKAKEIGQHIVATTGGFVDVAIVTHEHQDHVNGFTETNFPGLKVGKVWFAWTENPKDDVANQLRKKFKDRLLKLIDSRAALLGAGKDDQAVELDWYLEFELGDEKLDDFNGALHLGAKGKDPASSANKIAMKFLRDCAEGDPEYLYPHEKARAVPGAKSARAFVLGPPHDIDKIDDLDPIGDENFGDDDGNHGFGAAAGSVPGGVPKDSPFPRRHVIALDQVFNDPDVRGFFSDHYGVDEGAGETEDGQQIAANAEWRRLTANDAADAGALALAMNNATNNASLVLAFELSRGGKVLLFVGDAQAGNWRSWSEDSFDDGGKKVTAKDLLGRTVLYKVGHHGSHNATLNGKTSSERANLAWMATGQQEASEFVAMITAVEKWAHQKPKPAWNHPLPAIKEALLKKAGGRVLQTDTALPDKAPGAGAAAFQAFSKRATETSLYFDLVIEA